jgi:tetratricopeptide (TPR) repeat protein
MDEDPGFNIFNEVNTPGNDELIYLLTPFEIIEILNNPEMKTNYKNKVFSLYEKNSFSYFTNLNIAILYFYLKDYSKFLLYLERSGSLKNMSEVLYLKSMCFLEVGYHQEAKKILSILNSKFPTNKEVEEKLKKII